MDLSTFKPKSPLRDPIFWTTVALPAARLVDPNLVSYLANHWDLIAPYGAFVLGHMGLRATAIHAAGSVASAAPGSAPVGSDSATLPVPSNAEQGEPSESTTSTPDAEAAS